MGEKLKYVLIYIIHYFSLRNSSLKNALHIQQFGKSLSGEHEFPHEAFSISVVAF
jgi:hypothetical protein